jgi:opine dehydrogenase
MSLVPISSFGKEFDIKTQIIDSIIHLANVMMGENYFESGRTVEKLGLKGKTPEEIIKYLEEGYE